MHGNENLVVESRTTEAHAWLNLYDEAHEMMMASFVSYHITFLPRENRVGRLKHSNCVLEKLHACTGADGDMTTELHPCDFGGLCETTTTISPPTIPLVVPTLAGTKFCNATSARS
ncbi:expressed unknown protein [Seminavis robusta]|uniref:Uncharacterized protein n=1 Tax=Seminavis robusta TaxID=568900 RepID=A0A9N8EM97_9STRA|nr:expressed unknown protein [Seminavis robusta]|eukprot:Sro1449_g273690.1 n/a (116) ;mRNA; r:17989-18336